jgi:hypothetical protein|tara:strand:- start:273 stop:626 length:354 start_codon:yes stop_codon:yes gene_type:complete
MAITPQAAKAKGRRLQQWVRDRLYSTFPELEDGDIRSTSMGAGGEDLLFSPAARRSFPYSVECKNNKINAIYKVMDQATSNCPKGATPLAIIKADQKKPLAVVDADHFFKLAKRMNE